MPCPNVVLPVADAFETIFHAPSALLLLLHVSSRYVCSGSRKRRFHQTSYCPGICGITYKALFTFYIGAPSGLHFCLRRCVTTSFCLLLFCIHQKRCNIPLPVFRSGGLQTHLQNSLAQTMETKDIYSFISGRYVLPSLWKTFTSSASLWYLYTHMEHIVFSRFYYSCSIASFVLHIMPTSLSPSVHPDVRLATDWTGRKICCRERRVLRFPPHPLKLVFWYPEWRAVIATSFQYRVLTPPCTPPSHQTSIFASGLYISDFIIRLPFRRFLNIDTKLSTITVGLHVTEFVVLVLRCLKCASFYSFVIRRFVYVFGIRRGTLW